MSQSQLQPVLIVGAGPTGMTAALDLAHYGIPSIILDDDHQLSQGSRAIAFHQSALAVWEKLGAAQEMLSLGLAWCIRHTYRGSREIYIQDFGKPAEGYLPRYINIPQFEVERILVERINQTALVDLRWDHKVTDCVQTVEGVTLSVETPHGMRQFRGSYVLACDGARSSMRKILNLDFPGQTFNDFFLIADIKADLNFSHEPRFFFDHSTNPGHTVLIHPQPGGVWRIDWQLGSGVDPESECTAAKMDRRIRALIGETPYQIVWLSHYRFHQRLLDQFIHGRVFFAGDSAHLVAPFGARGMNSAIQDVENLVWKLAFVLTGVLPPALLETYQSERWAAQAENQKVTISTMRFMAPDTTWLRLRRNLILSLSEFYEPARKWVDSGKMSIPFVYESSVLCQPDRPDETWEGLPGLVSGGKLPDLPVILHQCGQPESVFLRRLFGSGFVAFYFAQQGADALDFLASLPQSSALSLTIYPVVKREPGIQPTILDTSGSFAAALGAAPGTLYLARPDGHLALRLQNAQPDSMNTYFQKMSRV